MAGGEGPPRGFRLPSDGPESLEGGHEVPQVGGQPAADGGPPLAGAARSYAPRRVDAVAPGGAARRAVGDVLGAQAPRDGRRRCAKRAPHSSARAHAPRLRRLPGARAAPEDGQVSGRPHRRRARRCMRCSTTRWRRQPPRTRIKYRSSPLGTVLTRIPSGMVISNEPSAPISTCPPVADSKRTSVIPEQPKLNIRTSPNSNRFK
mgnify:CR=1 FL=1